MDTILEVKNLKVSFRTTGGTVKAVRNISFSLPRGKTLAIVGESGSGKSVTSKAILGILAGNSIIEGGEILYDGKDLLKITEEEMCEIRGNRISMIFQDPLSSLNPIVKIGRQITEAMLLKDKGNRREAKKDYNNMLSLVRQNSAAALGSGQAGRVDEICKKLAGITKEASRMENDYNNARVVAEDVVSDAEDFLFMTEKHQKIDARGSLKVMAEKVRKMSNEFLTAGSDDKLSEVAQTLREAARNVSSGKKKEQVIPASVTEAVKEMESTVKELLARTAPDFFSIGGYHQDNPSVDIHSMPVEQLNETAKAYLDSSFLQEFLEVEQSGVEYSFRTALEKKKEALEKLKAARGSFADNEIERKSAKKLVSELAGAVEASIDRMEIKKDSMAYTFRYAMNDAIDRYCNAVVKNPKEEARFARQSRKREALIARGKTVDWKVVPKLVYDLDELKDNITQTVDRMIAHYETTIENSGETDFRARSQEVVDYMNDRASQVVFRVSRSMARDKALELMEEVGIPEPRIRYNQYPFEFSGGMRQRIVIAIALAANPDILICDEPTTALDVTIQAQILELINKLKEQRHLSVIFITHDLGVVANMADDIAVMYAGKIVEFGTADEVFYDPRHPYTWALLSSMPDLDTKEKLDAIPGTPPNMIYPPEGDAFAARNKYALQIDFEQQPPAFSVSPTHWAATWLLHPDAPEVKPPKLITDRIERMLKAGGEQV